MSNSLKCPEDIISMINACMHASSHVFNRNLLSNLHLIRLLYYTKPTLQPSPSNHNKSFICMQGNASLVSPELLAISWPTVRQRRKLTYWRKDVRIKGKRYRVEGESAYWREGEVLSLWTTTRTASRITHFSTKHWFATHRSTGTGTDRLKRAERERER